jgi:hypothetical protein
MKRKELALRSEGRVPLLVKENAPKKAERPAHAFSCKPSAFRSAPGRIRTSDTGFRKPLLYPLSYRRTVESSLAHHPDTYHASTR